MIMISKNHKISVPSPFLSMQVTLESQIQGYNAFEIRCFIKLCNFWVMSGHFLCHLINRSTYTVGKYSNLCKILVLKLNWVGML